MHFPKKLCATLIFLLGTTAHAQYFAEEAIDESFIWRGPPLNDETLYKHIQNVELRKHSTLLRHPYEVIIPNTVFGDIFFCQLFGAEDEVVIGKFENAQRGDTHIFFAIKDPVNSAVCVDARDPKLE